MTQKRIFLFILLPILLVNGCARAPKRVVTTPMISAPSSLAGSAGFYHTMQAGQTLYRIAKTYKVDLNELMRVNHISDPSHLEVGRKIFIPQDAGPVTTTIAYEPLKIENIRQIVGPKNYRSDWRTITVHHSGTTRGSARLFDRDHRRRKMGGLFYHFVIGNGSYTADGSLEVGWRWKKQVKANRPYDIQICLVGNYNEQEVSTAQFATLVHLVRTLQDDYRIITSHVRRHEDIKGKNTECPGKHFPFQQLLSSLGENS